MVDHLNVSYLYKKRGVFYFSKRIPCDVKSYYKNDRIVKCLRTKSNISAIRASKSLYQRLDDYWTSIRLTKMQVPAEHMLLKRPLVNTNSNAPLLSEALSTYLKLKGEGKNTILNFSSFWIGTSCVPTSPIFINRFGKIIKILLARTLIPISCYGLEANRNGKKHYIE